MMGGALGGLAAAVLPFEGVGFRFLAGFLTTRDGR